MTEKPTCEGCNKPLGMLEAMRWNVCMDCTRARARAVANHSRCTCGNKARPTEVMRSGSRTWISCHRCLGSIRQLT